MDNLPEIGENKDFSYENESSFGSCIKFKCFNSIESVNIEKKELGITNEPRVRMLAHNLAGDIYVYEEYEYVINNEIQKYKIRISSDPNDISDYVYVSF